MTGQEEIDLAATQLAAATSQKLANSAQILREQSSYQDWISGSHPNYDEAHRHSDAVAALVSQNAILDQAISSANALHQKGVNDQIIEKSAKEQLIEAEKKRIAALPTNEQASALASSQILINAESSKRKYWIIGGIVLVVIIAIVIVIYIRR